MAKDSLGPLGDRYFSFQSNEDRKREQRGVYHREFDGIKWMKHGVVPPKKGGHGRVAK